MSVVVVVAFAVLLTLLAVAIVTCALLVRRLGEANDLAEDFRVKYEAAKAEVLAEARSSSLAIERMAVERLKVTRSLTGQWRARLPAPPPPPTPDELVPWGNGGWPKA